GGEGGEVETGARRVQGRLDPVHQPQGVHHEFEGQLVRRHRLPAGAPVPVPGQVIGGGAGLAGAQDAALPGAGDLAVGAGADAEVVAKAPVVEVVAGLVPRPGPGGHLVGAKAGGGQVFLPGILDGPQHLLVRQGRGAFVEDGIGLDGELVPGQVGGVEIAGEAQVRQGLVGGLPRQAVHQVEVEVGEAGGAGGVDGGDGGGAVVYAAQLVQLAVVETLHADGQAVDPGGAVAGETPPLQGAGVGLEGDLDVRVKADQPLRAVEDGGDAPGGEQAGGAAADENGGEAPALDVVELGGEVRQQRPQIGLLGNLAAG